MSIFLAIILFFIGIIAVNSLKLLHIQRNTKQLLQTARYGLLSETERIKIAYRKSLPYTPAYYLLVWITCSTFYFLLHASRNIYKDALITGILWCLLAILLEIAVWIKTNHKYRLTWKEMYMIPQPWLPLCYYAVLISPIILSLILK